VSDAGHDSGPAGSAGRGGGAAQHAAAVRDADDRAVDRLVRRVLTVGLIAGAALLVAGFVIWAVRGGTLPASVQGPVQAVRSMGRLEPVGFFSAGLLVIILTPFVRVAGTIVVFLRGRDWVYSAVTATVLLTMIAGLLVGAL